MFPLPSLLSSDLDGLFVLHHIGEKGTTKVEEHEKHLSIVENDPFYLLCGGSKFDYKAVSLTHETPGEWYNLYASLIQELSN